MYSIKRFSQMTEINFSDDNEKSKLRAIGKTTAGVGMAAALAGGISANKGINDLANEAVSKTNGRVTKTGWGLGSRFTTTKNNLGEVEKIRNHVKTGVKSNKWAKYGLRADRIGTAAALAGGGLYLAGRIKDSNKRKNS